MITYIGLGSNEGDRLRNIICAFEKISLLNNIRPVRMSSVYETEPVQCEGEWFYNTVVEVESDCGARDFMKQLLQIESELGRVRTYRNLPRPIDIDLLMYENMICQSPDLILPHPRMHERRFVLEPLCEVNEKLVHPVLLKTAFQMLLDLKDSSIVRKVIQEHRRS